MLLALPQTRKLGVMIAYGSYHMRMLSPIREVITPQLLRLGTYGVQLCDQTRHVIGVVPAPSHDGDTFLGRFARPTLVCVTGATVGARLIVKAKPRNDASAVKRMAALEGCHVSLHRPRKWNIGCRRSASRGFRS